MPAVKAHGTTGVNRRSTLKDKHEGEAAELVVLRVETTLNRPQDFLVLRPREGKIRRLAAELQVSPKTVKHWLAILERMYVIFIVRSYGKKISRALSKPVKAYFFDNGDVPELGHEGLGPRFENLVATHLLKRIHFLEDRDGYRYELCYVRDKEKREVDFAVVREGVVGELVEAKWSRTEVSRGLRYYSARLEPRRATQVVATLRRPFSHGAIEVTSPIWAGLESAPHDR